MGFISVDAIIYAFSLWQITVKCRYKVVEHDMIGKNHCSEYRWQFEPTKCVFLRILKKMAVL